MGNKKMGYTPRPALKPMNQPAATFADEK